MLKKLFLLFVLVIGITAKMVYGKRIVKTSYTKEITNKYFSLPVGRKLVYESKITGGVERVEILIPGETKVIDGVETLIYWDRVWVDGNLVEETRDYLAQDESGNVWYFGEDVDNYEDGELVDHAGSWQAGQNGARPGIWMKAEPRVGESYRQEYFKGEAEDMARIVATDKTVTIKSGTHENCVQTYDWTPLDEKAREYKYYCPGIGAMVLAENLETGSRTELVELADSNENEAEF